MENNQAGLKSNVWKIITIVGIFLGLSSIILFGLAIHFAFITSNYFDLWFHTEILCLVLVLPGFFVLRKEKGPNRNLALAGIIIGCMVACIELFFAAIMLGL